MARALAAGVVEIRPPRHGRRTVLVPLNERELPADARDHSGWTLLLDASCQERPAMIEARELQHLEVGAARHIVAHRRKARRPHRADSAHPLLKHYAAARTRVGERIQQVVAVLNVLRNAHGTRQAQLHIKRRVAELSVAHVSPDASALVPTSYAAPSPRCSHTRSTRMPDVAAVRRRASASKHPQWHVALTTRLVLEAAVQPIAAKGLVRRRSLQHARELVLPAHMRRDGKW